MKYIKLMAAEHLFGINGEELRALDLKDTGLMSKYCS